MLIVRAPVRLSLGGGGTDFSSYYEAHGGMVVSTAINKYFYATFEVDNDLDVQITSSDYRTFYQHRTDRPLFWEEGDLVLPKAVLHHFGIVHGVQTFLASEVPPGTGLGSSSAVAVALVKGLATLTGRDLEPAQVASLASYIEIGKLGMPIGLQDQYASAFGGFNTIYFDRSGARVEPLLLPAETLAGLDSRLLLFFTHSARDSSDILRSQAADTASGRPAVIAALHVMKTLAVAVKRALELGDVDAVGEILDAAWAHKKQLSPHVSNPGIDEHYAVARKRGAMGGKLTGAGGGGFLMLLARDGQQEELTAAMEERGLCRMDYRLNAPGAHVLLDSDADNTPRVSAKPRIVWGGTPARVAT